MKALLLSTPVSTNLVPLDLIGEINAGRPSRGEQQVEACIPVDLTAMEIPQNARCFCLRVRGDSMVGANIVDGDIVLLEHKSPYEGSIVAALIDGESVLKRYVCRGGKPYLHSENPRYPDLTPAGELVVQGVLRGVIRRVGA